MRRCRVMLRLGCCRRCPRSVTIAGCRTSDVANERASLHRSAAAPAVGSNGTLLAPVPARAGAVVDLPITTCISFVVKRHSPGDREVAPVRRSFRSTFWSCRPTTLTGRASAGTGCGRVRFSLWCTCSRIRPNGFQEPRWRPTSTDASLLEAVRENEEVVPVNVVSTWVLLSGVTVGR